MFCTGNCYDWQNSEKSMIGGQICKWIAAIASPFNCDVPLRANQSHYMSGVSTIFQLRPHSLRLDTKFLLSGGIWYFFVNYYMLQTTGLIANLVDVNLSLFNLPTSLLYHYLQLSRTVTPSRASNRLCQFINPAAAVKTPLVYPWTMAADTGSKPATVRRQSRLFDFFFFYPHPTSAHRSPLLAKFKYMTQHCDSADELCLLLQVPVSCSWQFHSLSFSDVCFSAARPFKGQWF